MVSPKARNSNEMVTSRQDLGLYRFGLVEDLSFMHCNIIEKFQRSVWILTLLICLGKSSKARVALFNLVTMLTLLASWPTHVKELIPNNDHDYGYYNAYTTGAGGVWFSGEHTLKPLVWHMEFKAAIPSQVVPNNNPHSCLTNSDLEMVAVLLHNIILHQEVDMQLTRNGALSDNMPTVAWTT
jgi:hypothetical protein